MLTNALIVLLLFVLNGFFAMAELAIVSARRARLRQMAEEQKSKGAEQALQLADDPSRFLSIVQIGMTLNSVLAGAYSGATVAEPLGQYLDQFEWIAPFGAHLAMGLTVAGVAYLNLVVGELVPKRIGLAYAEPIAVRVSGMMHVIAFLIAPVVWILGVSTNLFLNLLGLNRARASDVTEEEVKDLIAEGTQSGLFKESEKNMLEGVIRLTDRNVRSIMTPRVDMAWVGIEDPLHESLQIVHESGYSRIPVGRGDMDEIVGILHAKHMLDVQLEGRDIDIAATMREPLIVPDTTPVTRLLDHFKDSGQHMAIVIDEYGSVEGLVTLTDVMEAIIGDLPETGHDDEDRSVQRADGSWLIDGMRPIDEVETLLSLKNMREGGADFHTLAGFIIERLGRLPAAGDAFEWNGVKFEVMDMDARRVDKVLVTPVAPLVHEAEGN